MQKDDKDKKTTLNWYECCVLTTQIIIVTGKSLIYLAACMRVGHNLANPSGSEGQHLNNGVHSTGV